MAINHNLKVEKCRYNLYKYATLIWYLVLMFYFAFIAIINNILVNTDLPRALFYEKISH